MTHYNFFQTTVLKKSIDEKGYKQEEFFEELCKEVKRSVYSLGLFGHHYKKNFQNSRIERRYFSDVLRRNVIILDHHDSPPDDLYIAISIAGVVSKKVEEKIEDFIARQSKLESEVKGGEQ